MPSGRRRSPALLISAGLVHDIRPADEIVHSLVAEAERALSEATAPAATCAERGS